MKPGVRWAQEVLPPTWPQVSLSISTKPWPLHAFWPLHELEPVLQELRPLHALTPTHFTCAADALEPELAGFVSEVAQPDTNRAAAAVASTVRLSLIAVFMGLVTLFSIDVEWAMPEKLADFSFGCLRRLLRNPVSGSFK